MSTTNSPFLGLRTVVYFAGDLEQAKNWYATVLGISPYFDTPYYVGFNVAGYELGLHPLEGKTASGNECGVAYWGVADVAKELERLIELGAQKRGDVQDVGEGIKIADVLDPFGNVFGIIENPNFPNKA